MSGAALVLLLAVAAPAAGPPAPTVVVFPLISEDTAANPAPDLDVAAARNMPELLKLLLAHG